MRGGYFDECYKKLVLLHEDDEEPLLPDTTEADIETPETQTSACGQQRDVSSWPGHGEREVVVKGVDRERSSV